MRASVEWTVTSYEEKKVCLHSNSPFPFPAATTPDLADSVVFLVQFSLHTLS